MEEEAEFLVPGKVEVHTDQSVRSGSMILKKTFHQSIF